MEFRREGYAQKLKHVRRQIYGSKFIVKETCQNCLPIHWSGTTIVAASAKILLFATACRMIGQPEQFRCMDLAAQIKFGEKGDCPILIAMTGQS
jgi:hypothetical protein